jgi:hypothetical protein
LSQRQGWFDDQLDVEPERLVFIDETVTIRRGPRQVGVQAAAVVTAGF